MSDVATWISLGLSGVTAAITGVVWISQRSFQRGQTEHDYIKRSELDSCLPGDVVRRSEIPTDLVTERAVKLMEDRNDRIYARNDVTGQRFQMLEKSLSETRNDLRQGFDRIADKLDDLKRKDGPPVVGLR